MKKHIILAALVAASFGSSASADTDIKLTGATAFRNIVNNATLKCFNATQSRKVLYTGTSSTPWSSNVVAIWGKVDGIAGNTTVRMCWSGSVEGIKDVLGNVSITRQSGGFIPIANVTALGDNATQNGYTGTREATNARWAFSDVFIGSTEYAGNATDFGSEDTQVGIIPFIWVRNRGSDNSTGGSEFTTMTQQNAKRVLASASPLSLFTGNSAASSTKVITTGRDKGSGTRYSGLSEPGFGINNPVKQYKIGASLTNETYNGTVVQTVTLPATNGTINYVQFWPADGSLGAGFPNDNPLYGNGGYQSGSNVAQALSCTSNTTVFVYEGDGSQAAIYDEEDNLVDYVTYTKPILISYLGGADANTALNNGAIWMKYNGITYNTDGSNVFTGQYSFWGYEHLYIKGGSGADSAEEATFRGKLLPAITASLGVQPGAGLPISNMTVTRSTDGGVIFAN